MSAAPEQITDRWLLKMKIRVSSVLLRNKLQSHPDYPSLLSITDILDELGIDNAALQVDKERLQEVPLPFLAHYRNEFLIISDIQTQIRENPEFEKNWNGTALLAEKPENWEHAENIEYLKKERIFKQTSTGFLILISGLVTIYLANNFSWLGAGLMLTSLAGIGVAVLIVQHELGIANNFTEQLCRAGKNTDCDAVLHSKGSSLVKWLNWADAGIIYFISSSLLVIIAVNTGGPSGFAIPAVLAAAAIPFTLFSLYYQWHIVKKWCTLCLLTVGLLWLQFALSVPVALDLLKGDSVNVFSVNNIVLFIAIAAALSAVWLLLLKPVLKNNKELLSKNFSLLRFKNNPEVFEAFLKQQRQVDTTPFENDLQLGNPLSPAQIVVACNPYCGPCATAHKILHELVETTDIGLTIRLNVKADNIEDKITVAGAYIMQVVNKRDTGFKRKVLQNWYEVMNLEKFKDKYPLQKEVNVKQQVTDNEQWNKKAEVIGTPTIFINGYQLPGQYRAGDLKNLLQRMIKMEEANGEITTKNNLALA